MLIEAMVSAPTMTRLPDGTLEWRPDEEYMQMLRSTFTRASDQIGRAHV